jgi:acetylornithine deacetylase/succinyl-diaminopimelate desuccinylase-like protein
MRWRTTRAALLLAGLAATAGAQPPDRAGLDAMAQRQAAASWELLREVLAIPNDSRLPADVERNVVWAREAFTSRGFAVETLDTGGPPLLLATRGTRAADGAGARQSLLVYLQLDGQPVGDASEWEQEDPYRAVLKERVGDSWRAVEWSRLQAGWDPDWRLFARSSADAKGPVVMFLAALDALAAAGLEATSELRVVMDFEEELGSPHLPAAVARYRDRLAADAMLIFDGPRHASNLPTLDFGARGIATLTLTVFGPKVPQHSGHYGNYVPNPALRLAQLLASMEDADGRVTIPGFYDGVELDRATREILAATPDDVPAIHRALGIAAPEAVAPTYQESLQYPSLNVRGMASGWVGEQVRTVIPATATAELDVRLVPEVDAERLIRLIYEHVRSRAYLVLEGRSPTDEERALHPRIASLTHEISYGAFRTPLDTPVAGWLRGAMVRAFGSEPVRSRMMGGSIPISPFVVEMGIPAVIVPTAQRDNNQHSPNENLRLGNFVEGIATFLAILTEPLAAPAGGETPAGSP